MARRLENKVVLVTGAGGAIGRASSVLFAREGARLVLNDVASKPGEETLAAVKKEGAEAVFLGGDISKEADVRTLVADGAKALGGLDVVYNNAGIFPADDAGVTDLSEDVWDHVQDVNLKSQFLMCKHAIPKILERGKGAIVNIASFTALLGCTVPQDAYTASKGGVIALSRSLAVQYGRRGLRTNCICPGPIETPMLTNWLLTNPEAKQVRLNRIPMGRFGKPEDVGNLALFLASDESSWINGAVIVVDGGITANYF